MLERNDPQKQLRELQQSITEEARSSDVRHIPAYSPPGRALLLEGLRRTQSGKEALPAEGLVTYSVKGEKDLTLDPARTTDLASVPDVDVERRSTFALRRSVLPVKKPDMLGRSQWQLKYGDRTIASSITDQSWLARFHDREVAIRPGDAIVCDGELTVLFDRSGAPVSEKAVITKVYGVEYQPFPQSDLF